MVRMVWIYVGSAFTFDHIAMISFVNTVIGASAGAFGWLIFEYILKKTTSLLGLLSGALSGLVYYTSSRIRQLYECHDYCNNGWHRLLYRYKFN